MISLIYISTLDVAHLIEQNPAIGFDVSLSLSFAVVFAFVFDDQNNRSLANIHAFRFLCHWKKVS